MTRTLPLAAALLLGAVALPASASNGQHNLRACKAQLVADGIVTTERVRLEKLKRKTVTLSIEAADGTTREAVCKITRGEVASLVVEGTDVMLASKTATENGGN